MSAMTDKLKKAGGALLDASANMLFFIVGFVMRILWRGRVIYTDPAARDEMKRGAVLIADHKSHMDGFFVPIMLFPIKVRVLITRKWYDKKFLNPIFRHLPYIPINLNESDAAWIAEAESALKRGQCVMIFPEGRLEKDGRREPFKSGFLLPARHLDAPVIPMAIKGKYRVFKIQTLIVGSSMNLDLHAKGRLSAVLNKASEECEREVFALADGKIPDKPRR